MEAAPWYPFGYGLTYSRFHYENFSAAAVEGGIDVRVEVENGSSRGGDEIVEFYVRYEGDAFEKPHHKLVGFKRGNVPGHEIAEFHYHIPEKALMSVMENGKSVLLDGAYTSLREAVSPTNAVWN